jgi:hypothetical protein
MAKRWQYPIKADVIFIEVPPEVITLDKWFILSPDPLRKKPHITAFTHYLSFVSPIAVPEEVTLDKWFTQCSEPIKKNVIPYYYPTTAELFAIPETVTLDKWFVKTSEPVRPKFQPYYYPCIDYRELSIPFVPSVFKLFFDNYMRIEDE